MKKTVYEMIFKVTETLQNGNERQIQKSVYSPPIYYGNEIHEDEWMQKAVKLLKSEHYYNIEYLGTRTKKILCVE